MVAVVLAEVTAVQVHPVVALAVARVGLAVATVPVAGAARVAPLAAAHAAPAAAEHHNTWGLPALRFKAFYASSLLFIRAISYLISSNQVRQTTACQTA